MHEEVDNLTERQNIFNNYIMNPVIKKEKVLIDGL